MFTCSKFVLYPTLHHFLSSSASFPNTPPNQFTSIHHSLLFPSASASTSVSFNPSLLSITLSLVMSFYLLHHSFLLGSGTETFLTRTYLSCWAAAAIASLSPAEVSYWLSDSIPWSSVISMINLLNFHLCFTHQPFWDMYINLCIQLVINQNCGFAW